jgi:1-deoxy-D-xylulose-5-phosphate reductoisomerase
MTQPLPLTHPKRRSVTILGSTGSIGKSTVKLLEHHPEQFYTEALTAYDNVQLLAEQAKKLNARLAVIGNEKRYLELKAALSGSNIEIATGREAIIEAARVPSDIVIAGMVGAAGLVPAMAAIARGATVALANKECLVCAGDLVMNEVKQRGATLIPVDSEHSAIFQVFDFERPETIEKIIVTASGGPFRNYTSEQMKNVTAAEAVRHPNWNMGAKISVDSSTMMNKGLELIEAHHLFQMPHSKIEVLIHPESIIHSMVAYIDGSVLAQLGAPDMCTPIAYALAWPTRIASPSPKLDFTTLKSLTFDQPDEIRFPALRISREAMTAGGSAPAILNAANEVAVARFLKGKIAFPDIIKIIETTLAKVANKPLRSIDDVIEIDTHSRKIAEDVE